jgi:large subunit ribosomal protein L4
MAITTYTKSGTKATTQVKLAKDVFNVEVKNHDLLKAAYVAYLANGRTSSAVTKTRGLVSGGGRKPWKQKGTGRARFGSSRNPIWRGGGIVFGPSGNENYSHNMSPAQKRLAIRQALSLKSKDLKIVETFSEMEGKTKDMVKFLDKIEATGQILCVVSTKDPSKEHAVQNIPNVKVVGSTYLNVFDLLNADTIVLSKKSVDLIQSWLGDKKESK